MLNYTLVEDAAGLEEASSWLRSQQLLCIDTETVGVTTLDYLIKQEEEPSEQLDKLIAKDRSGLDCKRNILALIQVGNDVKQYLIRVNKFDKKTLKMFLEDIFERGECSRIIAHNMKFDYKQVAYHLDYWMPQYKIRCTQVGYIISQCGTLQGKDIYSQSSLLRLVNNLLGEPMSKEARVTNWLKDNLEDNQLKYAAKDIEVLPRLYRKISGMLKAPFDQTIPAQIEFAVIPPVVMMELNGYPLNTDLLLKEEEKLIKEQHKWAKYFETVWKVNYKSASQMLPLLQKNVDENLKSTDKKILAGYKGNKLVDELLEAKGVSTLIGFINRWKEDSFNGRIYAEFHALGTRTGRFSSSGPNMQQIPRRLRKCFKVDPGRIIVQADYSQLELRMMAYLSGDSNMTEGYHKGLDGHTITASLMAGIDPKDVTKQQRSNAKPVNFGLIYSMQPKTLVNYALALYGMRMTLEEAQTYYNNFFKAYPDIQNWHIKMKRHADKYKYVKTLSGRVRVFTDAWIKPGQIYNTPDQGSCGDGIKLAMIKLYEVMKNKPEDKLILQVHDELHIETDESNACNVQTYMLECMVREMSNIIQHKIPIVVDSEIIHSYGDK